MHDKAETLEAQLAAIDQATLTPLVRNASGNRMVKLINWECEQLYGGVSVGTAIYRFSGQGRDQGSVWPWSLILKILWPEADNAEVSAWNYYKREADAYQSGRLNDRSDGLVAPHCFGVVDHPDGTCWIWLEEVVDQIGPQWPLSHYRVVARHLGRFNGIYLTSQLLPDWPWLSADWMRNYVELSAPAMEPLRTAQASPWGRRWLPEKDSERFFCLWDERALYLDILDRLPQTICHLDVFRRNLFAHKKASGDNQTVVIDWASVGRGPIGAELSPLVWMSIALGGVGLDNLQELEQMVFDGYLEGLREIGWKGDPQQVRLGYTAATIRYLFPEAERWLAWILDESLHASLEQATGISIGQIFDNMALLRSLYFEHLDEARSLMGILL